MLLLVNGRQLIAYLMNYSVGHSGQDQHPPPPHSMMSPLNVMDYKHTPIDREGARLDISISIPAQHQLKGSWGAQSMILHTRASIFSCRRHAASQRDNFLSILAECRLVVSSVAPGAVTQHSSHQHQHPTSGSRSRVIL